ncbi:MAG: NAD(P)-dependent alcohol dehydrogenase [Kibdelosporangium sp.]
MKAIVHDSYGSTEVLRFRDVDRPEPGDDEVLLQVHAAGAGPDVWHVMTGMPYAIRFAGFGVRRPKNPVLGRDVAGRVAAVGGNVTGFKRGDEVLGIAKGSFAEFACASAAKLAHKPAALTFEQAAALPISGITALKAVRDNGKIQPGQRVLIIGAGGGVGTFAVQLAKQFGAEVTAVCGSAKADLVRSIGADHVVDYTRESIDGRYDVILDIAGCRSISALRRNLVPRGTLVLVGGEDGGRWFGLSRALRAVLLSPFIGQRLVLAIATERGQDIQFVAELAKDGKVTPVVGRTHPLIEAPGAIRHLQQGHATGKIVITI